MRRCVVSVVVVVVVVGAGVSCVCVTVVSVEELIGVSVTTGAGVGAGTGVVSTVEVVDSVVDTVAGDCVTVTFELAVFGTMFTSVLRPVAEPLPAPPVELDVYALPLLSTLAG